MQDTDAALRRWPPGPGREPGWAVSLLPLPPDTAVCLKCGWMSPGPDANGAADRHTKATSHPTIASLTSPSVPE
jgi:hypothetical protein